MISEVQRRPDSWFRFTFNGTPESIDELVTEIASGGGTFNANVEYVSPTAWKYWNPYFSEPIEPNAGLETVAIFRRETSTGSVVLEADFPNQTAADNYWEGV